MSIHTNIKGTSDVAKLSCMSLPLRHSHLLLPSITIAEITTSDPFEPEHKNVIWDYGVVSWHDVQIPLIDIEIAAERVLQPVEWVRYMAVIHSQQESTQVPFFAIVLQGVPKPLQLEYADLALRQSGGKHLAKANVDVGRLEAWIPDIVGTETLISGR